MKESTPKRLRLVAAVLVVIVGAVTIAWLRQPPQVSNMDAAVAEYGRKEYDSALERVNQEIAANPTAADRYNFRANIQRDKGNYDQAAHDYAKAVELNPQYLNPWINWASMQINRGEKDKAKEVLEQALKNFPDQPTLKKLYGELGAGE